MRYRRRRGVLVHVGALGLLAALVAVPAHTTAGAATGWTNVPSASEPAPPSNARLQSIVCRTPTSCVTVGRFDDPARPSLPLAGRLTSTGWSFATAPIPLGGNLRMGELKGVACATATKCFAVGNYWDGNNEQALIVRWDGKRWTRVAAPEPGTRGALTGIACPTSTRCFAVGSGADGTLRRTLVEMWNGTGWKVLPSPTPHPRGGTVDQLNAVACPSAANCLAIGFSGDYDASPATTFGLRWDGKKWTAVSVPNPAGTGHNANLVAIACGSATACFATGSYFDYDLDRTVALIERWNGAKWSIVNSYPPAGNRDSEINGVSCPTTNACYAIGGRTFAPYTTHATLFGRWRGGGWTFTTVPNTPFGVQQAISCPSATSCIAEGAALMQRWNGSTWTRLTTGASTGRLTGVSCTNASACVAVGTAFDFSPFALPEGLIQHWNGTRFVAIEPPRPPGATQFRLLSVACPGVSACFAVGSSDDGSGTRPLIERWDGSSWSVMSVPAPAGTGGLSDISCPDVSTCFAIGATRNPDATFVERWDGSVWTLAAAPAVPEQLAISCSSAAACLAVDTFRTAATASRWNGVAWTTVGMPDLPGNTDESLSDVSCLSATFCMAAGTSSEWNVGVDSALIARWNGSTWTASTGPTSPSFTHSFLSGVTCVSTTQCVAVGATTNDGVDDDFRFTRTLVEQWNGSAWSIVPSANPAIAGFPHSPRYSSLGEVSCAGATCLAVGGFSNAMSSFTLAERSP